MRAVIQRVTKASVKVSESVVGEIGAGLLILLAIHRDDDEGKIEKFAKKIINLRIFEDNNRKMNLPIKDMGGEILLVSQFTLYGDTKKGNRPSYIESAAPEKAIHIFNKIVLYIRGQGIKTEIGEFGANMEVDLVNDGPVTIIIEL